jgi:hypothetical protein
MPTAVVMVYDGVPSFQVGSYFEADLAQVADAASPTEVRVGAVKSGNTVKTGLF